MQKLSWSRCVLHAIGTIVACLVWATTAAAQGVTTGTMTGLVTDAQGAVLPGASVTAIHLPSGTQYEATTQEDGRFFIPAMRVGGPYKVTVAMQGFGSETKNDASVALGTSTDLPFSLKVASVNEEVTVTGAIDPTFSSGRTGAATAVTRAELATLPTISGRLTDITRLSPQYGGSGTFATCTAAVPTNPGVTP